MVILKAYHLIGIKNYGLWAFHMNNLFLSDNIYDYCIFAPNEFMSEQKKRGRHAVTSAIKISIKGSVALKLQK
jgi:hypothetical protein